MGAGPAGCLLALSLLDAARARRRLLSVSVYGASMRPRDHRTILADADAVLRLGASGLSVPATAGGELQRIRCVVGGSAFEARSLHFILPRAELVGGMRAAAMARGARMLPHHVDDITAGADGSWTLRTRGASERADLVILACGTGAAVAASLPFHAPPPLWRGCLAELEIDSEMERELGGALHWLSGDGEHPHLLVAPAGRRAHVLAAGPDVTAAQTARALCRALESGRLRGRSSLRWIDRVLLPAGQADPGIPAIGGALGGAPGWTLLSTVASQAHAFAAAVVEDGTGTLLDRSRREARRIGRLVSAPRMRSPFAEFGPRATALALERADGIAHDVPGDHPVARVIAAAIDPRPDPEKVPLGVRLRAILLLLVAGFLSFVSALAPKRRKASPPSSRIVYVVDDDPDHADLVGCFLGSRDIPYRTFGDGLEAIAAAARERPAAVVLDLGLPWLDGREIGRFLERISGATILLATALPSSLARARGAGQGEVLTKPLDLERLADRLQGCLPRAPADPEHRRRSG